MKRIISLILSVFLIAASFDFYGFKSGAASFDISSFSEYFYSEANKFNDNIDISEYVKSNNWSVDEIKGAIGEAFLSMPELYFVDNSFRIMYTTDGTYYINVKYLFSKSEKLRADDQLKKAAQKAVENITDSMSDVEKALLVHDYIIMNCDYDSKQTRYSAYDCLVGKSCVCQGFSLAYKYILENYCGIKCSMCASNSQNHIWNYVRINNKWYHVDLTEDNPTYSLYNNTSRDGYGEVYHNNFLISDDACRKSSEFHRNWYVIGNYDSASDKTYENYFWKKSNSPILYNNGLYYYLNDDPNSPLFVNGKGADEIYVNLCSYSFKNNKSKILSRFSSIWYVLRNLSKNKTYEYGKSWYKRSFSKIAMSGGYIYINTSKSIFRYRIKDGKVKKIYTLKKGNNQIYSIMMLNSNALRICYKYDNTYSDSYLKLRLE